MKKVGFYVKNLSDFQYLIPLNNFLSPIFETSFFIEDYISSDLVKNSYSVEHISNSNIDVLFSIDCDFVSPLNFENRNFIHIIIQNYHDFSASLQRKEACSYYKHSDFMWFHDKYFYKSAKFFGYDNKPLLGLLPNYWDYKNENHSKVLTKYDKYIENKNKKTAVCFLPRNNEIILDYMKDFTKTPTPDVFRSGDPTQYTEHAIKLSDRLLNNGYNVIFKQRTKHSNLGFNSNKKYIETNNVYPNESLDLSFIADFAYGYMTSSMMQASIFNRRYINFDNPNYPKFLRTLFNLSKRKNCVYSLNIEDDNIFDLIDKDMHKIKNLNNDIQVSQQTILRLLDSL